MQSNASAEVKDSKPSISETVPTEETPVGSWTSAAVSISGPNYQRLSSSQKSVICKLHHNLSHPTSERLADHLKRQGASAELIAGARDFLCASCAERIAPKGHPPGTLKESRDFNQRVSIDGFDWKSNSGYQGYVVHVIDEATQFHQGRRAVRDGEITKKTFQDMWQSWAGNPQELVCDAGGEFVSESWK